MTTEDRQKLFDRLMLGASIECLGDANALEALEQATTEDLDAIEPLIDEIVAREVRDAEIAFAEWIGSAAKTRSAA